MPHPLFAATLIASMAVQQAAEPQKPRDILVVGKSIADTRKDLDACLAKRCPPRDDINASLAHAENLFVGGLYHESQRVLAGSIRRNKRYRATLPVDVADLMRAWSRVSAHRGREIQARHGLYGVVDSMRAGLTPGDSRLLAGRLELAANFARQGRIRLAQDQFDAVARDARRFNNRRMEGFAIAQQALLLSMLARLDPGYGPQARRLLRELTDSDVPEHRTFGAVARLTAARMAVRSGDTDAIDALVADYQSNAGASPKPILLYGDPIELRDNAKERLSARTRRMPDRGSSDSDWIDIAFLVDGQGRTRDIEIVRASHGYRDGWATSVIRSLQSRRYTPPAMDHPQSMMRVERYSRTRPLLYDEGSRLLVPGSPTVRIIDLSDTSDSGPVVSR